MSSMSMIFHTKYAYSNLDEHQRNKLYKTVLLYINEIYMNHAKYPNDQEMKDIDFIKYR